MVTNQYTVGDYPKVAARDGSPLYFSPGTARLADLYCGIGGVSVAAGNLGLETVYAAEPDAWARQVYKNNTGLHPDTDITGDSVRGAPAYDLLYVCLRQTPASADEVRRVNERHPFQKALRFLFVHRPRGVIVEALRETAFIEDGLVLEALQNGLGTLLYETGNRVSDAADFGVSLHDERLYVVGTRRRAAFPWPEGTAQEGEIPTLPVGTAAETISPEMLRLYGFPGDWRLDGESGDEKGGLLRFVSPVPVVQAMLLSMLRVERPRK